MNPYTRYKREPVEAEENRLPMHCPTLSELPAPPEGTSGWPWTEESPRRADTLPDGSHWPRVSIVTPSYNQGQFLEATIRSVLLQGYPNLEYIVFDGGSTDDSVEILRRYEPWLAFWVSEPDRGQSHAINKGWTKATGDVFAWLNSDDMYMPGAIGEAVQALKQHPETALVYGTCQYIDADGRPTVLRNPGQVDFRQLLWNLNGTLPQPTTFIRRSILEDAGFLDETLKYSMDYELWLRIAMRYPLRHVEKVWAATRMHDEAKTVARQKQIWKQKVKILDKTVSSPDLPAHVRNEVPALYSTYYFRTASVYLSRSDLLGALKYLWQAVTLRPGLALEWQSWQSLLRTLAKLLRYGPRQYYRPGGTTDGTRA